MEDSRTTEQDLASLIAKTDRQVLVRDCVALVDGEVKGKSGISGMALKSAYATVKKVKPGFIEDVIDGMLDDWIARLSQHYTAWRSQGSGSFGAYLGGRGESVADDLLLVTDARAETTKHKTVKKLYQKLRPSAKRNVEGAVPGLGDLVERHAKG